MSFSVSCAQTGLEYRTSTANRRSHDATKLRMWREALDGRLIAARVLGWDDRRLRMWRFHLAYCEGFAEGRVGDVQLLFARPGALP